MKRKGLHNSIIAPPSSPVRLQEIDTKRPEGDPPAVPTKYRRLYGFSRLDDPIDHRDPLSPSIKTRTTSGRENSGGGMIPSFNMARTLVPDRITWCSSPWGQVL